LYELAPASWAQLLLMYLLWYNEDDDFFSLVKVEGNDDVPTYAILSHTWGSSDDELNFREVMNIAGVYRRGLNKDKKPTGSHNLINGRNATSFGERMRALKTLRQKPGYAKIQFCGMQAKRENTMYIWVDSCCIDRESSAELSESINSMFRWYQNAARCYVYLSDFSTGTEEIGSVALEDWNRAWKSAFRESRWFTRGWVSISEQYSPKSWSH
jgi:hypothetical protein